MYQMHRIFCATPWELEAERIRFHDLIGLFNETVAMPKGVLFVPVSLAGIRDKRPMQYAVDENIRQCRHYIQVLSEPPEQPESWGPVERNFRHDYNLALECAADPALPMQSVSLIPKGTAEFDACVNGLFAEWLASLLVP